MPQSPVPFAAGVGWPFLVGPGRRRDFSTLLAPDFLVAGRAHGILTDVVTARDDAVSVLPITVLGGRRLTLVFGSHLVTTADLVDAGTAPTPGDPRPSAPPRAEPLRDEHSRPLRLAYGFAVPQADLAEPAEADLAHALDTGLTVYRRFLAAEETFTVSTSTAFRLQTRLAGPPVSASTRTGGPAGSPSRPAPRRALVLAGILVLVAAITGLLFQIGVSGEPRAPARPAPATTSPAPSRTSPASRPPTGQASIIRSTDLILGHAHS